MRALLGRRGMRGCRLRSKPHRWCRWLVRWCRRRSWCLLGVNFPSHRVSISAIGRRNVLLVLLPEVVVLLVLFVKPVVEGATVEEGVVDPVGELVALVEAGLETAEDEPKNSNCAE